MTTLAGTIAPSPLGGIRTPQLSDDLQAYVVDYWPTHAADITGDASSSLQSAYPVSANARTRAGSIAGSYLQDYYYRVHLTPSQIDLGNLVTTQSRTIEVWNAWPDRALSLTDITAINGDGITVTGPATRPLAFAPLQSRTWSVAVTTDGPPLIDATLQWLFAGEQPVAVRITGNRLTAWVMPPDWSSPVVETLAWLTDVQQAIDGSEFREPCRETPRRQWEFGVVTEGQDRQLMEAALYDWTSRNWVLPVWPDMVPLSGAVAAGSLSIAVITTGLDFATGGLAMLWTGPRNYELVEVDVVSAGSLTLRHATASAWPVGARLYPCRTARLTDAPALTRQTDRLTTTSARFEAQEPCAWPAIAPVASYLGMPVLEVRPNESTALAAAYGRQVVSMDSDVGLVFYDDITGRAFPTQSHAWLLAGTAARAAQRSLLYWLQGRASALWVPSWADDITLAQPLPSTATVLTVAWAGISRHLYRQAGRRHVRIELFGGQVFYRAVVAAGEVDAATEQVTISTSLGVAIDASMIRQINWLMLCRLASDTVQIAHITDTAGVASVAANFAGVPGEEP